MERTQLRQLIKESIQEYIKEIDAAGNRAALEAKINATQEAIDKRKKLTSKDGLDEAYIEFLDERKMKEMTSEIKLLEKSMGKYKKQLEKMDEKKAPKTVEDKEMMDEANMEDSKTIDKLKTKASWNDQQRGITWNSKQLSVDGGLEETTKDPESGPQLEEDQLNETFEKLVSKLEKGGKSHKAAAKIAGAVAAAKMKGAGEGPSKKQKARLKEEEKEVEEGLPKGYFKKEYGIGKKKQEESLNESFLHMQKLAGLITETEYKQKLNENK